MENIIYIGSNATPRYYIFKIKSSIFGSIQHDTLSFRSQLCSSLDSPAVFPCLIMVVGRRSEVDNALRAVWHGRLREMMAQEGPVRSLTASLKIVVKLVLSCVQEEVDAHFGADHRAHLWDQEAIDDVVGALTEAFSVEVRRTLEFQAETARSELPSGASGTAAMAMRRITRSIGASSKPSASSKAAPPIDAPPKGAPPIGAPPIGPPPPARHPRGPTPPSGPPPMARHPRGTPWSKAEPRPSPRDEEQPAKRRRKD